MIQFRSSETVWYVICVLTVDSSYCFVHVLSL